MNPKKDYNVSWRKNNRSVLRTKYHGYYCETARKPKKKPFLIPAESSFFLRRLGNTEAKQDDRSLKGWRIPFFFDPHAAMGAMEKYNVAHAALSVDYLFMSANAIFPTGTRQHRRIRTDALRLDIGPSHVIVIAGMNKSRMTLTCNQSCEHMPPENHFAVPTGLSLLLSWTQRPAGFDSHGRYDMFCRERSNDVIWSTKNWDIIPPL